MVVPVSSEIASAPSPSLPGNVSMGETALPHQRRCPFRYLSVAALSIIRISLASLHLSARGLRASVPCVPKPAIPHT